MNDAMVPASGLAFLAGGGEMGALMRAHYWTGTPVGPPETWPQPLKTTVRLMLTSRHPMFVWWGAELTCFYNDAYSALIGPDRHPSALGRPGHEVWAEIWDAIGPQVAFVMAGQGATWHERQFIPITRGSAREDVWWTYGYSPVDDDGTASGVGGVLVICRDVTAEVRAEQAKTNEAERLRGFFEQAPGFMALLRGPDHVFELANAAYVSLVGRDVLGKAAREAVPEVEGQGFFELLDRVYTTGEAFTARRAPITFASGPGGASDRRFVDFVYQPVRDAAGAVTGIFVEGSDVTEATLTEVALRASEARFRTALAIETVGAIYFDMEGKLTDANDAFLHMSGYDREDLGGARLTWQNLTPPEWLERSERAFAELKATGRTTPYEKEYIRRDGTRWWALFAAKLLPDSTAFEFVLDISERKAAERQLRELNETLEARVAARTAERNRLWSMTNLLVAVAAFDSTIREVNPAWPALLGWSEAELVGRSYAEFVHPDDVERSLAWAAKLAGGEEVIDLENRYRCKDGSYRWIAWAITADDSVFHCVGRDVTGQKRQAEALAAAEEALRQAQKMEAVGQLTGGIAHDFNNMLQGIAGSLHMMQRRMEQERMAEVGRYVDAARQAVERAGALTHRLLAFARRQTLQPEPVEPNGLIGGMENLVRRTVGPAIAVELRLDDGAWSVLCDPNQLENVLLNLAINARDAMPEGGRLTIGTARKALGAADVAGQEGAKPGDHMEISVADTGTGMDEITRAHAFEPFFTTKPLGQGTGLGLSQLYGFVRQSDGLVRLDSAPGRGTTVRLYLPRQEHAREPVEAWTSEVEAEEAGAGGTVLLVEDEEGVRAMTVEYLRDLGYTVFDVADGPAALSFLRSGPRVDLLVTDVGLPGGMNGRQIADAARERRPGLLVLFITGYAGSALDGQLAPGMAVIGKPFALDALAAKVRAMLEPSPTA